MIRDFSKDEMEGAEGGQDTDLTLSGGTLFVLASGLLVLCTICFSIGYFVGHRTSEGSAAVSSPSRDSKPLPVPTGSGSKPGATGQPQMRPTNAAVEGSSDSAGGNRSPTGGQGAVVAGNTGMPQSQAQPAVGSQVHPALVGQTSGAQSSSVLQVQPAITQVEGWMVQIAAVSHSEDAEVLVNALRKRGYTATARREVGDNLIHVQTGPFANRNDANATRQKLLNDGYNAIVE
jgi:DedD protein